jgi:hypothetical protein
MHDFIPVLRRAAGVIGAGALFALGAAPGAVADDSGTGLVLGKIAPISGVKPGSTFEAPVTFTNTGAEALEKVWLSYSVTKGLSHTDMPSNCERWDVISYDEMLARSAVICEFDQAVEPGAVYAPEKPLVLKALDRALYDDLFVMVANRSIGSDENASGPVRGTGPAVKLVEQPAGSAATGSGSSSPDWDSASVRVNAVNTADFQVAGAELKGRVGATIDAQVQFTNAGPAWVLGELGSSVTRVLIKVPSGTTVVKGLTSCKKPAAGTYDCGTGQSWLDEGQVQTYPFRLKINKAVPGLGCPQRGIPPVRREQGERQGRHPARRPGQWFDRREQLDGRIGFHRRKRDDGWIRDHRLFGEYLLHQRQPRRHRFRFGIAPRGRRSRGCRRRCGYAPARTSPRGPAVGGRAPRRAATAGSALTRPNGPVCVSLLGLSALAAAGPSRHEAPPGFDSVEWLRPFDATWQSQHP